MDLDSIYDLLLASIYYFAGALLIGLLLALEGGHWVGKRRRADLGDRADEGATLVVGSILALLAFVLALNLNNATARYDRRMNTTLLEVNAIGTATLQSAAAGGEHAPALEAEFKDYLKLRRQYVVSGHDPAKIAQINADTDAAQTRIWAIIERLIAESPSAQVTSLMNSVNNAFDSSTAMRLATEYRMPVQFVTLLLVMSLLGAGAVGYQFGLTKRSGRVPGVVLAILWCIVVSEIIDIGSARIWSMRTDARVYDWSLESPGF